MRTVQRIVPLAQEPIFAKSARLRQNTLSSSTKAGATPSALSKSPSSFDFQLMFILLQYFRDNSFSFTKVLFSSLVPVPT